MEFKNLSVRKMYLLIRNCVRDSVLFRFHIYEKPNSYQLNLYVGGKVYYHVFNDHSYKEYLQLFEYAFRCEANVESSYFDIY